MRQWTWYRSFIQALILTEGDERRTLRDPGDTSMDMELSEEAA